MRTSQPTLLAWQAREEVPDLLVHKAAERREGPITVGIGGGGDDLEGREGC